VTLSDQDELQQSLGDRYELIRAVGQGASATVYLARDLRHDRNIALKVLHPSMMSSLDARRFLREIRMVAKLTHPHILPLLDSGEALGRPYYASPFIEGASLQDRLATREPLPIDEALRLGCEIADALAYAHAAGVLHRDIKPGNVLITGAHAVVADFGASRWLRPDPDDATLTQPGFGIGTPLYVSPEQGAGDSDLDARSDIYSLGCVIHEMLTGHPPFVGRTSAETVALRFIRKPEPVRLLRPEVPEQVEQSLLRALAIERDNRFATAGEFALALSTGPRFVGGTAPNLPSVAVLPFQNLGLDAADEHFSRGISEEIADTLARIRNLRVVARTSGPAAEQPDPRTLGRQLDVDALLEGSVRRAGDSVRVSARLVQASGGTLLWSESYTRKLADIFAVQAEIAHMVAKALEVRLIGQAFTRVAAHAGVSSEAHEFYLRARHAWNKRTEDQLERSVGYFTHAIALEPRFARAYAGLADTLVTLALYGARAPNEVIPGAKDAARHALEIDPTLAEAHAAAGCAFGIYDWDWQRAEMEFQRSMLLDPGYATAAHWYAMNVLTPLGRFDEALAQLRVAAQLDPLTPAVAASPGPVLYAARRFEESVQWNEKALQAEPHFFPLHHFLGQALVQLGEHVRAISAFERALALSAGSLEVVASLAHARAVSGDLPGAERLLSELEESAARRYVSPYLLAEVYLGLGKRDTAISWLERGCTLRAAEMPWIGVRPIFDELRGERRFDHVLDAVGFARRE
jgi:TolB-like protein/Tfp pilus assembly protein PilF/tRNA A-37 threonylcarbamoyl transferase component Bud32